MDNLEVLLKNNSLSVKGIISNFVSNYSNLTCKINLICADEIVSINMLSKNGCIEQFNLNKISTSFANSPKHKEDYIDPKFKELLRLTDPVKIGSDLQVFMQKGFSSTNHTIQEGESYRKEGEHLSKIKERDLYLRIFKVEMKNMNPKNILYLNILVLLRKWMA
jgi:hypothetical protein